MNSMVNVGLVYYYAALVAIAAFFATMFLIIWRLNRDTVAMLYSMLFGQLMIAFGSLALLRSPDRIFDVVTIGVIGRTIWIPFLFTLIALSDIYLAESNHHVSLLARLTEFVRNIEFYFRKQGKR